MKSTVHRRSTGPQSPTGGVIGGRARARRPKWISGVVVPHAHRSRDCVSQRLRRVGARRRARKAGMVRYTSMICATTRAPAARAGCRTPRGGPQISEQSILVPHVPTDNGLTLDLSPQDAGWTHIGFQLLRLPAGASWEGRTGGREVGLVGVAGVARVRTAEGEWPEVGGRSSPFEGPPHCLYLPAETATGSWRVPTWRWRSAAPRPRCIPGPALSARTTCRCPYARRGAVYAPDP